MRTIAIIFIVLLNVAAAPTTQVVEVDIGATLLTAKLKDATARTLFDEIAKPAGEKFRPQPPTLFENDPLGTARFSAEFDRQPYWTAVLEACDQAKLQMSGEHWGPSSDMGIALYASGGNFVTRPTHVDGPVLFVLGQIDRSNRLSYGGPPAAPKPDQLRITASILLEPRLRRSCAVGPVTVTRAIDDAGNELKPIPPPPDRPRMWGMGFAPRMLTVLLEQPAKPGTKLKELAGEIELMVPKRSLQAQMAIAGGEASIPAGANRLILRPMPLARAAVMELIVELVREEESDEGWINSAAAFASSNGMRITLQTNRRTVNHSSYSTYSGPDRCERRLSFLGVSADDRPQTVTVHLPLEMQTIKAKYRFVDLPMP